MSQQIPYKSITNTGKDNDINTLNVSGISTITNTTESTSSTTGALTVAGGVGIAKNLNVEGSLNVNQTSLDSGTQLKAWLPGGSVAATTPGDANNVGLVFVHNSPNDTRYDIKLDNANDILQIDKNAGNGTVLFGDTTESTSTTTGAIRCSGGVGIVKDLSVGGKVTVNDVVIDSTTGSGVTTKSLIIGTTTTGASINDTTALSNILIGNDAGNAITDADFNIGIGVGSLKTVTANGNNVCVGTNTGNKATGGGNTLLGHNAGNDITSGIDNICIGRLSDVSPGLSNQIAIGTSATCDAGNQCTIGNSSLTVIRPGGDDVCNLGSSTNRFKDLAVAGSLTLSAQAIHNATKTNVTSTLSDYDKWDTPTVMGYNTSWFSIASNTTCQIKENGSYMVNLSFYFLTANGVTERACGVSIYDVTNTTEKMLRYTQCINADDSTNVGSVSFSYIFPNLTASSGTPFEFKVQVVSLSDGEADVQEALINVVKL